MLAAPHVLVLVVAYNAGDDLQRCVDSLEAQTFQDWQAIIWDNCSQDDAVDNLLFGKRVRTIKHQTNIGFAAANNRAAQLAPSRFIATLNPDAFPEPTWLECLVDTAKRFDAEIVASLQLSDSDPTKLDGAGDCMSIAGIAWRGGYKSSQAAAPSGPSGVFAACAAAALYRRDAFQAVGGFEERFFCYYEDVDISFRIRLGGGHCVIDPMAVVRHIGSSSTERISGFAEYYGSRNRFWTFVRNMPLLLLPIALPAHILVICYVILRTQTAEIRAARLQGLKDGWAQRAEWMAERRRLPLWMDPRVFSWSPFSLSRRQLKTWRVKGRRR